LSDVSFHWYRTNVNVEACGVKHHNPNPNTPAMNLIGLLPVFLIDSFSVIRTGTFKNLNATGLETRKGAG
jgi:hypothetical protein